ncbi:MAG TPA: class I SAM-dependent methyltransferase [Candidatus Deferrimicrobium sp.]|nr:class I SAM-dependent methyltransferase [Candidatus Deferrimicrobium sp.]
MPADRFDAKAYWARLHEESSLRSVGQSGLPVELNRHLYAIARRNVLGFLRRNHAIDPPPARVFDAGAGTGFWTALWLSLGATTVDGCDLAPAAVERLRASLPGAFSDGDMADPGVVPGDASYDLVTVMNVLLHILDDDRFVAALRNVAAAVAPNGRLLLAEPVLTRSPEPELRPGASSRARVLSRYTDVLLPAGFVLEAVASSTVVGANPIERGHPRFGPYLAIWNGASRWSKRGPRRAAAVGILLQWLDRLLLPFGEAPSGKLLLFRRVS